MAGASPWRK